jgi:Uma2 family endonuclease
MGMAAPIYWTREMVLALPEDGNRYETVHGELLVSPMPRALHQLVVFRLAGMLDRYLAREPRAGQGFAGGDISWSDDTLVVPDLFVVPIEEARTLDWSAMHSLNLVVEVLSPSSLRADRFTKRRLYQEVRIPAYWIVDADARSVEVWTPDVRFPAVETERLTWQPAQATNPLVIELAELFRPL